MGLKSILTRWRVRHALREARKAALSGGARGLLLFSQTSEVIRAERVLKESGLPVAVKAPPPHLRTGCDLSIEYPVVMEPLTLKLLANHSLEPLQHILVDSDLLEPVSVYQTTDLGDFLMVRAANMKVTVCRKTGRVVNVSGGGCPDVPYLAGLILEQDVRNVEPLLKAAQTLCGYALRLACEEAIRLCGAEIKSSNSAA